MKKHVLIAGAGAAGLTAAIFAASAGARVTMLERTDRAGRKILMSGGTRCNVLPVTMDLKDYYTGSSRNRMKNIFRSWSLEDCRNWFEDEVGLRLACEAESNKWFPESNSAVEVRDLLLAKAESLGAKLITEAAVERIHRNSGTGKWTAVLQDGRNFNGDVLTVCTGGFSIPKTGTDGMGHRFLKDHGHKTEPVYPALTPLTGNNTAHHALSGLSLNVGLQVRAETGSKVSEASRTGFLFTHKGYSGPAVLDVSHFNYTAKNENNIVYSVNWEGSSREKWLKRLEGRGTVSQLLKNYLPNRLANQIAAEAGLAERRTAELKKAERNRLLDLLTDYPLPVSGDEGYRMAEVTGGGVPLEEIDTATLQSLLHPGLFLCGEILDVFGRIGGFNFYWAWVTGRLAGLSAAK